MRRRNHRKRRADESRQVAVKALSLKGRRFYILRWIDPLTGKAKEETTNIPRKSFYRKRAHDAARDKQTSLNESRAFGDDVTWQEFRERYRTEHLTGLAPTTASRANTVLDAFEEHADLIALRDLDARAISLWVSRSRSRKKPMSEATIASYLRQLSASLNWAYDQGMLPEGVPTLPRIKRAKGRKPMRSRPPTGEEYDRILAACNKVCPNDSAEWKRLIEGLWLSGLRIGEALRLSWDWDSDFSVAENGKYPAYRILAEGEKGHEDRLLPMTPDFAQFLAKTPHDQRTGLVFPIGPKRRVQETLKMIGEAAGVIVNREGKNATAHDLRRAFGTRWAQKVTPAVLQVLMRHADIKTTLQYYVEIDTAELSEKLWQGGIKGGNPLTKPPKSNCQRTT